MRLPVIAPPGSMQGRRPCRPRCGEGREDEILKLSGPDAPGRAARGGVESLDRPEGEHQSGGRLVLAFCFRCVGDSSPVLPSHAPGYFISPPRWQRKGRAERAPAGQAQAGRQKGWPKRLATAGRQVGRGRGRGGRQVGSSGPGRRARGILEVTTHETNRPAPPVRSRALPGVRRGRAGPSPTHTPPASQTASSGPALRRFVILNPTLAMTARASVCARRCVSVCVCWRSDANKVYQPGRASGPSVPERRCGGR